ncbi:alpha/beta hydrolase [Caballeronia sordidicola]|uniref:BD-FAE-like domain-containing protein n=1 Tax=Caballeronia sordidicola TaxID=196367 RepID=A0A242M4A9_CABSO|nr:alpha/beta hydrolase [Caballeronia sordidicola]OTP66029.1 hypothetical protein PAMC26510_36460 [Caballeronia sordidicola]
MHGRAADEHIPYGPAPSQFVELFRARGSGPFPVVVLLHGGCWAHQYGGLRQIAPLASALAEKGWMVWNIEYRGIDEAGGGFPGTYLDVAQGLQKLSDEAARLNIDLSRMVVVGHSAGAQLALWAAARNRIAPDSPLHSANPIHLPTVIGLGVLPDLGDADGIKRACGANAAVLTGKPQPGSMDVFADTSPQSMLPIGSRMILINGELDTVAPPALATHFANEARRAGDDIRHLVVPDASHYDEVSIDSPVWPVLLKTIESATRAGVD